jgi:hypothetical protein
MPKQQGKPTTIAIILLLLGLTLLPSILAEDTNKVTKSGSEPTAARDFKIISIDKISVEGNPQSGFTRVLYLKVKNVGLPTDSFDVDGYMYRLSMPHLICGDIGYTEWSDPWLTGEIRSIGTIEFSLDTTLVPGIYHIIINISSDWQEPNTHPVMKGNYFIWLNFIFPKIRLRY